jgi:hypothetical protein
MGCAILYPGHSFGYLYSRLHNISVACINHARGQTNCHAMWKISNQAISQWHTEITLSRDPKNYVAHSHLRECKLAHRISNPEMASSTTFLSTASNFLTWSINDQITIPLRRRPRRLQAHVVQLRRTTVCVTEENVCLWATTNVDSQIAEDARYDKSTMKRMTSTLALFSRYTAVATASPRTLPACPGSSVDCAPSWPRSYFFSPQCLLLRHGARCAAARHRARCRGLKLNRDEFAPIICPQHAHSPPCLHLDLG